MTLAMMSMYPTAGMATTVPGNNISVAQQSDGIVKGLVVDQSGEPLIGVSITVKGQTTGTVTDVNGRYSLKAAPGTTLVFSYIGYTPKEVKANSGKELNVTLAQSTANLDEVVVIG